MMKRFERTAAAVLVTMLAVIPFAASGAPAFGGDSAHARSAGAALTDATLAELLEQLGYSPAKVQDGIYDIKFSSGGWDWIVRVGLRADGRLQLTSSLLTLPAGQQPPAEMMARLLNANMNVGPTSFSLLGETIVARRAFENEGMTPAKMRRELDQFCSDILANASALQTPASTDSPAPAGSPGEPSPR